MPKVKSKSSNPIKSQLIYLFVVLIVLIAISTIATLMATGTIEVSAPPADPVENITDAESMCNQRVKNDHGAMLNAFAVDDLSSRYDAASGRFKMFYEVELYRDDSRQTGTQRFYVNCFVASAEGVIARVEYLEQKDFKGKPVRRQHGNIFGF